MRAFLRQCVAHFDYVLVNMEPIAPHGEAAGFAALLDGVILLVDAESTRREAARRAAAALRANGAVVLGALMTNRHFPIPERIYRKL
jgi:Mrp family chromosome partitioning ATPase